MALHKRILDAFGPLGWKLADRTRSLWWSLRRPVGVGVLVLVRDGEGRVLLIRNSYLPGWRLPGGAVDWGESGEQAALRELEEETGIKAESCRISSVLFRIISGLSNHILVADVGKWSGTPRLEGSEVMAIEWFSESALPADLNGVSSEAIRPRQV